MVNLRLKKLILEVVNNQLKDNDPPVTKQAYEKLLGAGYSASEAKEKIGAVVLTEIYDVMKENQPYDEKKYAEALNEMVQQSIDFEDTHRIRTEWDDWDELAQRGYDAQEKRNEAEMISNWWKAWSVFQEIMKSAEMKMSVSGVMESQDYQYPVDAWLQDLEMELGNTGEHEKRMEFCQRVLEMFDWTYDDADGFRCAIGEELYATGKVKEGKAWFENWLKKEPDNSSALNVYSWCIQEQEGAEKAWLLVRKKVIGTACTIHNYMLFERAKLLAGHLEKEKDLEWIEMQLTSFNDSVEQADYYNDLYDDFRMPVQQPIVKAAKVYPNDSCPCGSGKKYKKCCGRK